MLCHARYPDPQTPLCWVLHLLSAKRLMIFARYICLVPHVDCCVDLQIRKGSPPYNHKSHENPRKENRRAGSLLSPERAALGESGLTTGRLAQNGGATLADDDGLSVGENGGDREASGALDIHEE